tara:strand:+ start:1507 stop:2184 length:678 start_codon:yes stop_codon:yes gene_type:complete
MRILHHWPLDPFSREVRLALAEKGLDFDLRLEKPWSAPDSILSINPAGTTPVLIDDLNGSRIAVCEAGPVLEYLEEAYPDPALMPKSPAERAEMRRLVSWFDRKYDGEVNAYLLHEKLEKRAQGLGAPDPAMLRLGREHLRGHLDYLSGLLEARDGLAGPRYTYADLVAAAHLSCADYLGDVPWDEFEPARTWYARVKCRPAFRGLLADRLPGLEPASHYADLDF